MKTDAERYAEVKRLVEEWWFRAGYASDNRLEFTCQLLTGGTFDVRELIADFVLQMPYQEKAALLSRPDAARLHEIAKHLLSHDPYRKALEDHMRTCPGPPLLLHQTCPKCGAKM